MKFDWDDEKPRTNRIKHGVDFAIGFLFEFDNAGIDIDNDLDYGEERLKATGLASGRVYVMAYTEFEDRMRTISLR